MITYSIYNNKFIENHCHAHLFFCFFSLLYVLFEDFDYLIYLNYQKKLFSKEYIDLKKFYQFFFYHDNICKNYD